MKSQIGTVTLLRDRLYGEVSVPAGIYPVYHDDSGVYWEMQGYLSSIEEGIESLGEGTLLINPYHDVIISSDPVEFPSKTFEVEDFRRFITSDPLCVEGPAQRLQFNLTIPLEIAP